MNSEHVFTLIGSCSCRIQSYYAPDSGTTVGAYV